MVYGLSRLYEVGNLEHPHLEQWYNTHVWRITDTVFDSIDKVDVVRESCSAASCEIITKGQVIGSTQLLIGQGMDRPYDLILRAYAQEYKVVI
ncbi:hypothetical protein RMATCC62417_07947 [Rhizopus microsporus]|nr:hypothetical protein RMATCC62417_07947 [Rhizopus microsporus]